MATPRTASVGPERTRQQLQELDALLQQMLALPAEEAAARPPAAEQPPRSAAPMRPAPSIPAEGTRPALAPRPAPATVSSSSGEAAKPKRPEPLVLHKPDNSVEVLPLAAKRPVPLPRDWTHSPPEPASLLSLRHAEPPAATKDPQLNVYSPESVAADSIKPNDVFERSLALERSELLRPSLDQGDLERGDSGLDPFRFDLGGLDAHDVSPGVEAAEASLQAYGKAARAEVIDGESLAYRGLLGVNRALESPFHALGPVGRPFLTNPGRNFLGWLGLVLLIGSAAVALGVWLGLGWIW